MSECSETPESSPIVVLQEHERLHRNLALTVVVRSFPRKARQLYSSPIIGVTLNCTTFYLNQRHDTCSTQWQARQSRSYSLETWFRASFTTKSSSRAFEQLVKRKEWRGFRIMNGCTALAARKVAAKRTTVDGQ